MSRTFLPSTASSSLSKRVLLRQDGACAACHTSRCSAAIKEQQPGTALSLGLVDVILEDIGQQRKSGSKSQEIHACHLCAAQAVCHVVMCLSPTVLLAVGAPGCIDLRPTVACVDVALVYIHACAATYACLAALLPVAVVVVAWHGGWSQSNLIDVLCLAGSALLCSALYSYMPAASCLLPHACWCCPAPRCHLSWAGLSACCAVGSCACLLL